MSAPIEHGNKPLRPPLRMPASGVPELSVSGKQDTDAPKSTPAKPANARNGSRYARKGNQARKAPSSKPDSEAFAAAKEKAVRMGRELREELAGRLTPEECERVARAFRSAVIPKRKPGRRRNARITAAYLDWKDGIRGRALYLKHIPGWERHHRYRRNGEQKALIDAVRSRDRREPQNATMAAPIQMQPSPRFR